MKGVFFAGAVFGIYVFADINGGIIEGSLFPVSSDTEITRIEAVGETRSRFWGSFRKLRECDFERLEFFLGTPQASARVDLVFEEGSKQRSGGFEDFGPWVAHLDPEQLTERSFAVAYHRCHPLWLTRTNFYPQ